MSSRDTVPGAHIYLGGLDRHVMTLTIEQLLHLHWLPITHPCPDLTQFHEVYVWTPAHADPERRTIAYWTDGSNHLIIARDRHEHIIQVWEILT